jgi:hypothetical protein
MESFELQSLKYQELKKYLRLRHLSLILFKKLVFKKLNQVLWALKVYYLKKKKIFYKLRMMRMIL